VPFAHLMSRVVEARRSVFRAIGMDVHRDGAFT
jgi:hypothetical protein